MSVSVVVPTYNGAAFVRDAIESIVSQTEAPDEVVVVDDASTDGTYEAVLQHGQRLGNVIKAVRRQRNSGGPAVPINQGIRAASGEMIAVLDQDDCFAPGKIAVQRRILKLHPEVSMVAGLHYVEGGGWHNTLRPVSRDLIVASGAQHDGYAVLEGRTALRLLIDEMFLGGYPCFMFRRSLWQEKGGVEETWRLASDYEFACWLCTKGKVAFVPEIAYVRREHDANLCRQRQLVYEETIKVRARYLGWLWRHAPEEATRSREWLKLPGMAYWLRETGHPIEAARCMLLQRNAIGRECVRVGDIAKCFLIGLCRARWPRVPPL